MYTHDTTRSNLTTFNNYTNTTVIVTRDEDDEGRYDSTVGAWTLVYFVLIMLVCISISLCCRYSNSRRQQRIGPEGNRTTGTMLSLGDLHQIGAEAMRNANDELTDNVAINGRKKKRLQRIKKKLKVKKWKDVCELEKNAGSITVPSYGSINDEVQASCRTNPSSFTASDNHNGAEIIEISIDELINEINEKHKSLKLVLKPTMGNDSTSSDNTSNSTTSTDNQQQQHTINDDINDNSKPVCAICLLTYEPDDLVCTSNNIEKCQHIFHEDCMIQWLMKNHEECPCCRTNYLLNKRNNNNNIGDDNNGTDVDANSEFEIDV